MIHLFKYETDWINAAISTRSHIPDVKGRVMIPYRVNTVTRMPRIMRNKKRRYELWRCYA